MSDDALVVDRVLSGTLILLVEDLADSRDLFELMLSSFGADVVAVDSAAAALAALETHRPNIILSDIGLPDEDGVRLFEKIRARAQADGSEPPPVVAITAHIDPAIHLHIYEAGFRSLIVKPIEPQALLDTIRHALA